jgi:hypothetical protein
VPDKQPTWMSWQLMTHRGPGRWTKNHLTTDGRTMLCGCRKPDRNVFCEDGLGGDNCLTCELVMARIKAGVKERR